MPKPPRTQAADSTDSSSNALAKQIGKLVALGLVLLAGLLIERYCSSHSVHFAYNANLVAIDGDTLKAESAEYRLFGIDAPELQQTCIDADGKSWTCGRTAQARLKALVTRRAVDCAPRGTDSDGRKLALCGSEAVADFGDTLVREGLAIDLPLSKGAYAAAQSEAQAAKRGIWQGGFQPRAEWHAANPATGTAPAAK